MGPHGVVITAADSNVVRYQDEDVQRSGIDGGFGVFGTFTRIGGTVSLPATSEKKRASQEPLLQPRTRLPSE